MRMLISQNFCEKCVHSTVWKNEKFTVTQEKFRQINSSKNVTFTKFLPKIGETKSQHTHCVEIYSHAFLAKFRESNGFTKEITR